MNYSCGWSLNKSDNAVDLFDCRIKPFRSWRVTLGTASFKCRMNSILDSGDPLDVPSLENNRILKAASLFALLGDSLAGIAGYSQTDLMGNLPPLLRIDGKE